MHLKLSNSRKQWKTEEPGMLQSMGAQRVRHDWTTFLSSTSYMTTAFMLASEHPVFQIKILYCIQYCTVKYTKAQTLVEVVCIWQCKPDMWINYLMWLDIWIHVYILENLPLEGSYVGDLLYLWYALRGKKNAPFLSFLESKKKKNPRNLLG